MASKHTNAKTLGSAVSAIPVALGLATALAHGGGGHPSVATTSSAAMTSAATGSVKRFSIPIANLRQWAHTVVVTLPNVQISGHSPVHPLDSDCEIHLGGHTPAFQGVPDGLVLEPMNACVQPFPDPKQKNKLQNNADWVNFAEGLTELSTTKGVTITATGVPRIWPEHLVGGGPSNPDHAVELHPLIGVVSPDKVAPTDQTDFNFAGNVFAGQYSGGLKEPTALAILKNTSITVTKNGDLGDIAFKGGTIGNFTLMTVLIDRTSMQSDSDGSTRMNGAVVVQGNTRVPVRLVTVKGSPLNERITKISSNAGSELELEALVLFSLSPESVLAAADKSTGQAVKVDRPIQLILYGTPDDQ
jgi:hypothetical protein